jgi:hypothetical protein
MVATIASLSMCSLLSWAQRLMAAHDNAEPEVVSANASGVAARLSTQLRNKLSYSALPNDPVSERHIISGASELHISFVFETNDGDRK